MLTGLRDHFIILGWNVSTVDEVNLKGADDKTIARYAHEHDFILISEDRRPVEFMRLLGGRYLLVDTTMIVRTIIDELEKKYQE